MKRETRGSQFEGKRREHREERVRLARRTTTTRSVETGHEGSVPEEGSRPSRVKTRSTRRQAGGRRRPTVNTGASLERVGAYVDKIYGNQGHRKGRKNPPRRSLTLGNQVRRKTRKRVEVKETKDPQVVSQQRVRQRMGGVWDRRHVERRKAQRTVRRERKDGESGHGGDRVERRERYRRVREGEVRDNAEKRRKRYVDTPRGKVRQGWRVKERYGEEPRRQGEKEKEREGLKTRYGERQERRQETRVKGKEERETWRERTDRGSEGRRAERERKGRRGQKERDRGRQKTETKASEEHTRRRGEARRMGGRGARQKKGRKKGREDPRRTNLPRRDLTQESRKRKNLIRRVDRESLTERERKKWRKVPEKERTKRQPRWADLHTRWEEERARMEKGQRTRLRQGGERRGRPYVDRGKALVYGYGRERNRRGIGTNGEGTRPERKTRKKDETDDTPK
jgi:hypothetical protein